MYVPKSLLTSGNGQNVNAIAHTELSTQSSEACYNDETEASKKRLFMQQIKAYKDTLIAISDPNTASYVTNKCGRLGLQGKWDEAIQILSGYYEHCADTNPDKASVEYLLAELYLGKRDMQPPQRPGCSAAPRSPRPDQS